LSEKYLLGPSHISMRNHCPEHTLLATSVPPTAPINTSINTMTAWRPVLRPIATIVIAAQLALVLQPLSALAQDKGQAAPNPLAQSQLKRINLLSRDIEAAQAQKQLDAASPADKASADLARIEEISKTLHADLRARGLAAPTVPSDKQSKAGKDSQADKDTRALGPNIRIQTQRSPEQNAQRNSALRLQDNQRQAQLAELKDLLARQSAAQAAITAEFAATRLELEQKKLPAEILARHDQAAAQFTQRAAQFNAISQKLQNNPNSTPNSTPNQPTAQGNAAQAAPNSVATTTSTNAANTASGNPLEELHAFFAQYPNSKRAAPSFDPQNPKKLPWSTPEPTQRAPAETKTAWLNNLHKDYYAGQSVKLAQLGSGNIGGIQFTQLPEPTEAPSAADLAETAEVKFTTAIKAKALELGNNPVNIHNWLRNTLEWAPTWGAMQSAQDTLDKKRGNSADIASLEIALLRAAGIPARYQYGTIELTAPQLQNWVGGTTSPEAAQQIIGQGGIASRGIAEGGRFTKVRMEHVWVQAYVNWAPSRGAKQGGRLTTPETTFPAGSAGAGSQAQHVNPNAALNAWVPLDASFKQYSYSQGMDLKTAVPLDANALLTASQVGATVNAAQGWVQNLNQAAIQTELTNYQTRLKTYIDSTPTGTSSTVGDVIGKKIIPQQTHEMLAGSLPYTVVLAGNQASSIPSSQQHQFTYRLSLPDPYGYEGTEILSFTDKLSNLVGKRLTLSYIPATQADADVIASYLPKANADGSPIRPDQLPTSLPGYLIRLKAQINLDGTPVATSSTALSMGTDLASTGGFTKLSDIGQWDLTSETSNVVGQATAIGISAGGISAVQLTTLKDRLAATQAKLQQVQANPATATATLAGVTGEQISGDLLTATIWSWFAAAESHNRLSQNQANMIENQGLSYGLFHAIAQPVYSWGVVRKVTFPGVNMDIGHVRPIGWSKDNNRATWIAYNKLRGQYMSALEHAIPERFFNDPAKCNAEGATAPIVGLPSCPQGISAVKAIGLAAAQGQKIYTITQEVYRNNPNVVNTNLSALSYSTKQGIQNALDAGNEVTAHERPITQSGWTGSGYTFTDPETGAGGYIIDGGSNGGFLGLDFDDPTALLLNIAAIFVGLAKIVGGLLSSLLNIFTAIDTYFDLLKYAGCPGFDPLFALVNIFNVLSILIGLAGLFFPAFFAIFFIIGVSLFLIGFALGAVVNLFFEATCRR
jgi:Transglutaminase-like superfamily